MSERHWINDRYRIDGRLGQGGMGQVFRARDMRLQRTVALKLLPKIDDERLVQRFQHEAMAIAQLNHPNIVTIFDYDLVTQAPRLNLTQQGQSGVDIGRSDTALSLDFPAAGGAPSSRALGMGHPFIVMEYLSGADIDHAALRGAAAILRAMIQVCEALSYAHQRGIIHRDIKPENIRLTEEGRVKLVDFGIASVLGQPTLTRNGELVGTYAYMSPEQALGHEIGVTTDIYSLGLVLYELLTGDLPFGDNPVASLSKRIRLTPPVQLKREDLSSMVEAVIRKTLARDPRMRPQSAQALKEELEQALASLPTESPTQDPVPSPLRSEATPRLTSDQQLDDLRVSLIGRSQELNQLEALLRGAASGAGGALFLGGDQGIGKSALGEAAISLARAQGLVVLKGQVVDEDSLPFEPFVQILRHDLRRRDRARFGDELGSDVALLARVVPDLETFLDHPDADCQVLPAPPRSELVAAVQRYLDRCADEAPLLVILEDFHDADEASVSTLRRLSSVASSAPLAVLVLYTFQGLQRDEPFHGALYGVERDSSAQRLTLRGLRHRESLSLIAREAASAPKLLAELIAESCEGNPRWLMEVIQHTFNESPTGSQIKLESGVGPLVVPPPLREAVARRCDALSPEDRKLIQHAAVLGRGFGFDALMATSGRDEDSLIDFLERAVALELVREEEEDQYRFVTLLIWQLLYAELHPRRRARLHRQMAEYYSRDSNAVAWRAHHFAEGQTKQSPQEALKALRAAQGEVERLPIEDARWLLRRQLCLAKESGEEALIQETTEALLSLYADTHQGTSTG